MLELIPLISQNYFPKFLFLHSAPFYSHSFLFPEPSLRPMFHFCTPWKRQKTCVFLAFSGDIEVKQWPEMLQGSKNTESESWMFSNWAVLSWQQDDVDHMRYFSLFLNRFITGVDIGLLLWTLYYEKLHCKVKPDTYISRKSLFALKHFMVTMRERLFIKVSYWTC